MSKTLVLPCDVGEVSDGFHTFEELYEHRNALFIALLKCNVPISWRAKYHQDGSMFEGFFVAGMGLPTGQISYHLPLTLWDELSEIHTMEEGPKWDGHTPSEVVYRLLAW